MTVSTIPYYAHIIRLLATCSVTLHQVQELEHTRTPVATILGLCTALPPTSKRRLLYVYTEQKLQTCTKSKGGRLSPLPSSNSGAGQIGKRGAIQRWCGPVERLLRLPEVPVEALVDAAEEIGGRVHEAGRRNGPRGDAADEGVAGGQLLPVLPVERCPCVPAAVVWHLYAECHVLRQYQRPEG
jgi:hypothetical protein